MTLGSKGCIALTCLALLSCGSSNDSPPGGSGGSINQAGGSSATGGSSAAGAGGNSASGGTATSGTGGSDACATAGIGAPPLCATGCLSPCGCDACNDDEMLGQTHVCTNGCFEPIEPPTTEQDCVAVGGEWRRNLALEYYCALPHPDGGNACTDASQCEGTCVAPDNANQGDTAVGTCSEWQAISDCFAEVRDGTVGPTMCP